MSVAGKCVLIVEDEPIVAIALEDMLIEGGADCVRAADTLDEAFAAVSAGGVELAVLDVNVHGRASYPVADELMQRRIPFIFATGYGDLRHPDRFAGVPTIAKPYARQDVLAGCELASAVSPEVRSGADIASAGRRASDG